MTFDFHPEAETELLEAIAYYENCAPGLGEDFSWRSIPPYRTSCHIRTHGRLWKMMSTDV
jgi:hypothetical protein